MSYMSGESKNHSMHETYEWSSNSSSGAHFVDPQLLEQADAERELIEVWHPNLDVRQVQRIAKKYREETSILQEENAGLQRQMSIMEEMSVALGDQVSRLASININMSIDLDNARLSALKHAKTSRARLIYSIAVTIGLLLVAVLHA